MNTLNATNRDGDDEALFAELLRKPVYAWPTLVLFTVMLAVFIGNSAYAFAHFNEFSIVGFLPAILVNTICSYMSYTIMHEAAHGLVSKYRSLNNWIGRTSMLLISIAPFFYTYRYLHILHHQNVNRGDDEPDMFCARGPKWLLPFRWALMDYAYLSTFVKAKHIGRRPGFVKREFFLALAFASAVLCAIVYEGVLLEFIVLYLVPARIALVLLVFGFDYLPHYPHDVEVRKNAYQATNNRVGFEWLLTPLLLGQNYHLAHHIYPTSTFYRYRRIWRSRQSLHDAQCPRYVQAFRLHPTVQMPATAGVNGDMGGIEMGHVNVGETNELGGR